MLCAATVPWLHVDIDIFHNEMERDPSYSFWGSLDRLQNRTELLESMHGASNECGSFCY